MNRGSVGNYTFERLLTGMWEVKRGDFVMGVFVNRGLAESYCRDKDFQERG